MGYTVLEPLSSTQQLHRRKICTLLGIYFPQDDHESFSADVNALMPHMIWNPVTAQFVHPQQPHRHHEKPIKTAVMHAAGHLYPFCTRLLLWGSQANVNVCLAQHHRDAMYFAMKQFPGVANASHHNHHDMKQWTHWWLLVHELMCLKSDHSGGANNCLRLGLFSKFVQNCQHETTASTFWQFGMALQYAIFIDYSISFLWPSYSFTCIPNLWTQRTFSIMICKVSLFFLKTITPYPRSLCSMLYPHIVEVTHAS